ncbi:hypothetical protein ACWDTB_38490, partial [Streptomyces sp. NPDC003487]
VIRMGKQPRGDLCALRPMPSHKVDLAAQAVTRLEASPAQYEHAAARVEYGILARSGDELERGLELARSCGADGLAERATRELETVRGLSRVTS